VSVTELRNGRTFGLSGSSRVLIFGRGQLGLALERAAQGSIEAIVLGRDQVNVTMSEEVRAAVDRQAPCVVINATAYTAVDRAETDEAAAFAVNDAGVRHLARACASSGVPLIHVSTDYVFDGEGGPYREDDVPAPRSVYGRSKLAGEEAVRSELDRHIIFRTAWLFGPDGSNFVKTVIRLAATRDELSVVDDQQGCPTPVARLADAILTISARVARGEPMPWGTYHFAGSPSTTWFRFAQAIAECALDHGLIARLPTILPIATSQYPTRARRPANSVLSCDALTALRLTQPGWRDGLEATFQAMAQSSQAEASAT
jgi:dTDP-4-dehydrorhamnose reductase